jgi:hypothetical protein
VLRAKRSTTSRYCDRVQLTPYLNGRKLRIAELWRNQSGPGEGGASDGVRELRRPIRPAGNTAVRLPEPHADPPS